MLSYTFFYLLLLNVASSLCSVYMFSLLSLDFCRYYWFFNSFIIVMSASLFINIITTRVYLFSFINIYVTLKLVNLPNWSHHFSSTVSASDWCWQKAKNITLQAFKKFGQEEFISYYLASAAHILCLITPKVFYEFLILVLRSLFLFLRWNKLVKIQGLYFSQ
jgi:hypothetical protein